MSDEPAILVFSGSDENVRAEIETALRVQVRNHNIALVNACNVTRPSQTDLHRIFGRALIEEFSVTIPTDNVQHLRKKLRIKY